MMRVFVASPKLFSFLNLFEVQAYGLFFVLGLLLFLYFFLQDATKTLKISAEKLLDIVVISLFAGIAGARLLYVFEFPELMAQGFWRVVDPRAGGLSLLGGLVAAPVAGFFASRFFGVSSVAFLDRAALYAPLIDFLGRLGCFFGGCCYGIPFQSFFSVVYLDSCVSAPLNVDLLPIQLVASAAFLGLFAFLMVVSLGLSRARVSAPGVVMFSYFAGAGFVRFFIDFFRDDRSAFFLKACFSGVAVSVTWYQIISLGISFFSLAGVVVCLIRAKKSTPVESL